TRFSRDWSSDVCSSDLQPIDALDVAEAPRIQRRILNHWDNLDRTVERGYAGFSLWDWHKLPDYLDPRYTDYARANASIGINGTVDRKRVVEGKRDAAGG